MKPKSSGKPPKGSGARSDSKSAGRNSGKTSNLATLKISYRNGSYPYKVPMGIEEYEATKEALQAELIKAQDTIREKGRRILVLFEGRDAAGKGGTIKRFMEHLNPRHAKIVALEKPNPSERGQWYFQRYVRYLPTRGQMVFFDRSWYNRTGVERVLGFCKPREYRQFLDHCPLFERMLVESGITLLKYWFSVSRVEQERRFKARESNPLKKWKLSPIDREALPRWDDYTSAKEAMFEHTDTDHAPWTVVKSDDKKRARINCLRHFLSSLKYPDKDHKLIGELDEKIVMPARTLQLGPNGSQKQKD